MLRKLGFIISVFLIALGAFTGRTASAQQAADGSDKQALAIYADAAAFQNNGAFELAIEEWQKLLNRFPTDPLAPKAHHYLGVSYLQNEQYKEAIGAFEEALKDAELEVREEALINLSWCLLNQARADEQGSPEQKTKYRAARRYLTDFLKAYADSDFADQAVFNLGEVEYGQGNKKQAVTYYRKLLDTDRFKDSSLRTDAIYALAVTSEELGDNRAATENYRRFIDENEGHRLIDEVSLRLADLLLVDGKPDEAEKILAPIAGSGSMADYTLLRLGYAQSEQGNHQAADRSFQRLLSEHPESKHIPNAAIALGQSLYRAGKLEEAVTQFSKALAAKDERAADAAHWMAIALIRQGRADDARKHVEDALAWARDNVVLQMDYADALYALPEQLQKARAAYELIARDHEDSDLAPRASYNAAFAALQMRDFDKAREWSEWFLTRFPQDPLRNDVAYVAAEALLQEGEHAAAAKAYRTLREAAPTHETFDLWTLRLAMAEYLDGKYATASKLIDGALTKFTLPDQKAEALFISGASLLYQSQVDQAIQRLTASHDASDSWGASDEVLLLLAEAYQRKQDDGLAKQTLEKLLAKYPQTRLKTQVEYKLGQLSAALKEYDEAIARYQKIAQQPGSLSAFANYGIAWCYMQQEKYQPALEQLTALLDAGSAGSVTSEALLARGVCERKLGKTDSAIESLKQFLDTKPSGQSLGNGLYELGLAYTDQRKLDEANSQFQRLLNDVPNYPSLDRVLYELAWNFEEATDRQKSVRYFERLLKTFADSEFAPEAAYMVAQDSYSKGEFADAAQKYADVIAATDDPALVEKSLYKLGWSMFELKDYQGAREYFEQQLSKRPDGPLAVDGLFMSAECAFKQERFADALPQYQRARQTLEADPQSSAASDQVRALVYLHGAQCLREAGDWKQCEKWLQVIYDHHRESPYLAAAQYEMGFCLQQQKKNDRALEEYEKAATYRNETGARARFMIGDFHFANRDFQEAIRHFQRAMYGYGGDNASGEVKNWQAKAAYEAARCIEVLIADLNGEDRSKMIKEAQEKYQFILENHEKHELADRASARIGELRKLR